MRNEMTSIPKFQRYNRGSCWACNYLSMLGLELIHVSKGGSEVTLVNIAAVPTRL